jgi:hypothetical protein
LTGDVSRGQDPERLQHRRCLGGPAEEQELDLEITYKFAS